jgi:hypothetical protein
MKNTIIYNICIILLFSCNHSRNRDQTVLKKADTIIGDKTIKNIHLVDTTKNIHYKKVDTNTSNYIVPDMFILAKDEIEKYRTLKTFPFFKDKNNGSYLYFEPYTDGSISMAILSADQNISKKEREMLQSEGFTSNLKPIQINKAETFKSINIDTKKETFIGLYSVPQKTITNNGIEKLFWSHKMKESTTKQFDYRELQPFILNGLTFDIEASFKENKLIKLVYYYEVP